MDGTLQNDGTGALSLMQWYSARRIGFMVSKKPTSLVLSLKFLVSVLRLYSEGLVVVVGRKNLFSGPRRHALPLESE